MKKNKLISISLVILLVIGIVFVVSKYSIKGSNSESNIKKEQLGNILSKTVFADNGNIELGKKMFGDDIIDYSESINKGDFEESIKIADKIINNIDSKSDSDISFDLVNSKLSNKENKKIVLTAAKYLKASALLNHGNYYYKEKESGDKADKILSEVQIVDESLLNNPYGMYFLGYSKEIKKEYSKAIEYYNKGIEYTKDDNKLLAVLYNQIGHVLNLIGKTNDAYIYYKYSYDTYPYTRNILINYSKYLISKFDFINAEKVLIDSIKYTKSSFSLSEIYYNLGDLQYFLKLEKKDLITKSIDYANKSIDANKNYPFGYYLKAKTMIYSGKGLNDAQDYLITAIGLYPNFYNAYEELGMLYFDVGELSRSREILLKGLEIIDKDNTLLGNAKNTGKAKVYLLLSMIEANYKNEKLTLEYIYKMLEIKDPISFNIFINEIKNKDYGKYSNLKNNEVFIKLTKIK